MRKPSCFLQGPAYLEASENLSELKPKTTSAFLKPITLKAAFSVGNQCIIGV